MAERVLYAALIAHVPLLFWGWASVLGDVVLLKNGSLIEGRVERRSDQVVVHLADGGRVHLNHPVVEFIGPDASAALDFQADGLSSGDLEGQVRLIGWCLRHGLTDDGLAILERVRHASPDRAELGALERLLRDASPPGTLRMSTGQPRQAAQPVPVSAAVLARFARRVQPILINRCATAGCHGNPRLPNLPLKTTGSPWREPRRMTQSNLQAVLTAVDSDHPESSLLLVKAVQQHGVATHAPFQLRGDRETYRELVEWVRLAAADQQARASGSGHPEGPAKTDSLRPAEGPGGGLDELRADRFNEQFLAE